MQCYSLCAEKVSRERRRCRIQGEGLRKPITGRYIIMSSVNTVELVWFKTEKYGREKKNKNVKHYTLMINRLRGSHDPFYPIPI